MLNFLKNIAYPSQVLALYLTEVDKGQFMASYLILNSRFGKLKIVEKGSLEGSLDTISSNLPADNKPVLISLGGKGVVIHKWNKKTSNKKIVLKEFAPNASIEDFHISFTGTGESKHVALIRKTYIEQIIHALSKRGMKPIDFAIAPFLFNSTIGIINPGLTQLRPFPYYLEFKENQIKTIRVDKQPEDKKYSFFNEALTANELVGVSQALMFYTKGYTDQSITTIKENSKEVFFAKLFRIAGISAISFYFIALLISFFLFNSYNQELAYKQSTYQSQLSLVKKAGKLQQEVLQKKELLREFNQTKQKPFSVFIDGVAATVPEFITFNEININPRIQENSFDKTYQFRQGEVIITGQISHSRKLTQWIERLKKIKEIEFIDIIEITKNEDDFFSTFYLKLKTNYAK